jgi:hypothetical protein
MDMKRIIIVFALIFVCLSVNGCSSKKSQSTDIDYFYKENMTIAFDFGDREGVYTGSINDGLPDGYGAFESSSTDGTGWIYYGKWEDGHFSGKGITEWDNGTQHIGSYKNDKMNGLGIFTSPEDAVLLGEFKDGEYVYPSDKPSSESPDSDDLSSNNDYKIYLTKDLAYHIPSTWEVVNNDNITYYYPETGFLMVQAFDTGRDDYPADELLDGFLSGLSDSVSDYDEISTGYIDIGSDIEAKEVMYYGIYDNIKYANRVVAFYLGDTVYAFAYAQPTEIKDMPVYEEVISSITTLN